MGAAAAPESFPTFSGQPKTRAYVGVTMSPTTPMSTGEAAKRLGVCERTVRRYIEAGQLQADILPSGHARIAPHALDECLQSARSAREALRGRRSRPKPANSGGSAPKPAVATKAVSDQLVTDKPSAKRRRLLTPEPAANPSAFDLSSGAMQRLREQHAAA
jgi:excisionase family DNA binding protein